MPISKISTIDLHSKLDTWYTFEDKLEILEDISGNDISEDPVIIQLQNTFNTGVPMAWLYNNGMIEMTERGTEEIIESFYGIVVNLAWHMNGAGDSFDENFGNLREVLNLPDMREILYD